MILIFFIVNQMTTIQCPWIPSEQCEADTRGRLPVQLGVKKIVLQNLINQAVNQVHIFSTPLNYGRNQIISNSNFTITSDKQINEKLNIPNFEDLSFDIKQSLESLVMKSTTVISSIYHLKMTIKTRSHNAQCKETI